MMPDRSLNRANSPGQLVASRRQPRSKFTILPPEIRLMIWDCAVEPRIVLLQTLEAECGSYPLPSVTQLNFEAKNESRGGYERIGHGSYFHFARDILVCDHSIVDKPSDDFLEKVATRIERVAFWDCFPDDGIIDSPYHYSLYLSGCYRQRGFGAIEFDNFCFPNVRDMWIVKVGEVNPAWMVHADKTAPRETQLRQLARKFRYWVDEKIIEMAPLDLDDPEVKLVLREGRCGKGNCHDLNRGLIKMISRVTFKNGKYRESRTGDNWVRIHPFGDEGQAIENRMRWAIVERTLTFSLRWESSELDGQSRRRSVCRSLATEATPLVFDEPRGPTPEAIWEW